MKIYIFFFLEGNKNCRVGTKKNKKNRVGRVSGNTGFFFFFFLGLICMYDIYMCLFLLKVIFFELGIDLGPQCNIL